MKNEKSRRPGQKAREESWHFFPVSAHALRCVLTKKEAVLPPSDLIAEPAADRKEGMGDGGICVCEEADGGLSFSEGSGGEVFLHLPGADLTKKDVITYSTLGEEPVIERVKTVDGERNFIRNLHPVTDRQAYRARLFFDFEKEEGIYGLGQGEDGVYNWRGHEQFLYQHNMRTPMPVLLSSRGWAVLVDCQSLMTFEDTAAGSYLFLDTVEQLDFYVCRGENPGQVLKEIRRLTGKASMLPAWAFGYVQSKERYKSASELLETAARYRSLKIPLDCIVQDWYTWEEDHWGEKKVDKSRYGDLKERIDQIHALNVHTMVSVWPNMNAGTTDHEAFLEKGWLLNDLCTYDAFNEKARSLYFRQILEELWPAGFDSFWCDSTEPFSGPDWNGAVKREPWERFMLVGEEHKKFLDPGKANAYALMHARGIYENQRQVSREKRVVNLTRSGFASMQRYGAVLWSGDICARWDVLKKQIAEGLNMAMSGYPYWTLDIGGFFTVHENWQGRGCECSGDPAMKWFWQGDFEQGVKDPGYRELYVRWIQLGAFLPMFRSHGTDTPREIWNFGSEGDPFYDAIAKYIRLRYELMPTIYSLAAGVHFEDELMMRSLVMDFAGDERVRDLGDEFLFGPSLLVCPVTEPMYYAPGGRAIEREKKRALYLPAGADWTDFYTGEVFSGGSSVKRDAPLDLLPLYIKSGSILVLQKGRSYAWERSSEPYCFLVNPGADASFTLYEDEGDGCGYEKGIYSKILLSWDDKRRLLTIGKREGAYQGLNPVFDFTVRDAAGGETVSGRYEGKELCIRLG